jgi:DNA-binding MarR family transcriptional regulator
MHAAFFGLKRAFHGTLRVMRTALTKLGLTAARFDMLYALPHRSEDFELGMRQSALRRTLGVSAPTVSRMLASLEELGLVGRERAFACDRRQLLVRLTRAGRALIQNAERLLITSGLVQLTVDSAFDTDQPGARWCDEMYCIFEMDALEGFLKRFRRAFGDIATLYYPWRPDE